MILTAALGLPLLGSLMLTLLRGWRTGTARLFAMVMTSLPLCLLLTAWWHFDGSGALFQLIEEAPWPPTLGMNYRIGVDGIALAIALMSSILFVVVSVYPVAGCSRPRQSGYSRPRQYYAGVLLLESAALGTLLALDLLLFYLCFNLALFALYRLIRHGGDSQARYAAFMLFMSLFIGSLVVLLALIALYLAIEPHTFDMRRLIAAQPLAEHDLAAPLVLLALMFGFAIKTPLVPLHGWLPLAQRNAPGPVAALLVGVLLTIGAFGIIRIPFAMMRTTFAAYAWPIAVLALLSILYASLVALGQKDTNRRIACLSMTQMGYAVLSIAVAGMVDVNSAARALALSGATVELVAHGLISATLILLCSTLWQRRAGDSPADHDGGHYGLLARTPRLATFMLMAAFATLGVPGLAEFIARFQILIAAFTAEPWLAAVTLLGMLLAAAVLIQMLQSLLLGARLASHTVPVDLTRAEWLPLGAVLMLIVLIGVYPHALLTLTASSATWLAGIR